MIDLARIGPMASRFARELLTRPEVQRDHLYNRILRDLGELFGADRCYIFHSSEDGTTVTNTYEWCAEGIDPAIDELKDVPVDAAPWFFSQLMEEGTVVIPDMTNLPPEAEAEKKIYEMQDIKSLLCAAPPDPFVGFLGFDMVRSRRNWTDAEVEAAGAFANIIVNGLLRERLELQLQQSIDRFETVSELSDNIIFEWNIETDRAVNRSSNFTALLGYDESDLGEDLEWWVDKLHPDDRERVQGTIETGLADPAVSVLDFQYRFQRNRGGYSILRTVAKIVRDETGKPFRMIGVVRDETPERVLLEEMERREERFRTLIDASSDVVVVLDELGRISFASGQASELLGFQLGSLIGKTLSGFVAPESRHVLANLIGSTEDGTTCDLLMAPLDGSGYRRIEVTASNSRDNPVVGGLLLNLRDVTERRRLEQRARVVSRAEALAAAAKAMGHEFNNVLMAIRAQADLIGASVSGEEVTSSLESIYAAIRKGRIAIERVNTRVDPKSSSLEMTLVGPLADKFKAQLGEILPPEVELDFSCEVEDEWIMTDQHQLLEVLRHLASTAVRAMNNSGRLEVRFGRGYGRDEIVVVISDEGVGMTNEQMERLFDPLFTSLDVEGSTMSLVSEILRAHGAEISVSSAVGEGTTFRVIYDKVHPDEPEKRADSRRDRGPLERVLMVEDEAPVAAGIKSILEMEGLEVVVMGRGRGVSSVVREMLPHVLIMDVGLPDVDGIELYREIEKENPRIPVVFSTGHGTEDEFGELRSRPEVALLHKPYEMSRLIEALKVVYEA